MIAVCRARRLAGRGLPTAGAPAPARCCSEEVAAAAGARPGRGRDRDRRLRRRLLRGFRWSGRPAAFSRLEALDGRRPSRCCDARAPGADRRRGRDRHRADARTAGVAREGGGGGADRAPPRPPESASPLKVADGNSRALRPALAAFGDAARRRAARVRGGSAAELPRRARPATVRSSVRKMFRICGFACNIPTREEGEPGEMGAGSFVSR